ncbi:MAG: sugar phosphate isomerase/epimerase [Nocardiopsaceae bacterium]|nr:sugar phosphate isomerase/epimerase [Nocardiopsaceae bacterium]
MGAIGLWREHVADFGLAATEKLVRDAGLRVSSLCRGGFFGRPGWLADNRAAIDEAAELGAACLVLVPGGLPTDNSNNRGGGGGTGSGGGTGGGSGNGGGRTEPRPGSLADNSNKPRAARGRLAEAREGVADAVAELVPYAARRGVRLAIEPMHPMYCADRGVVSTLGQALDMAGPHPAEAVGVVVDTFHLWWDPEAEAQIARAGREGRIASFQVSDFLCPLPADVLLGRAMMGDGVIDFGPLCEAVAEAGYRGDVEVEIFNAAVWAADPDAVLATMKERYAALIAPDLGSF